MQLLATGGEIEDIVADIPGAQDVKVEQITGLPVLQSHARSQCPCTSSVSTYPICKACSAGVARRRRPRARFSKAISRFDVVVSAFARADCGKTSMRSAGCGFRLPGAADGVRGFVPLQEVATIELVGGIKSDQSRRTAERRVVVTANVRGRDLGSFVQ